MTDVSDVSDVSDVTLPVVTPPFEGSRSDVSPTPDASVAGVLLAAGTSSRFDGSNKLLEPLAGSEPESSESDADPLVRHAARTLLRATELDAVAVVVGYESDRVRDALDEFDVAFVENPDAERGQATSVRAGVDWDGEYDALVFALGDMPRVDPGSVDRLVDAYRAGVGDALAAACDGTRGNPVLFAARHFDALADTEGDTGGREILLDGENSALVETDDSGVLVDIDTREDLRTIR